MFSAVLHCVTCIGYCAALCGCVQCYIALCGMRSVSYCTVWHALSVVLHCVACVECRTALCGMR